MKLLLDHNLSFRIIRQLPYHFKDSTHVYLLNQHHSSDEDIWALAVKENYTIVTKDTDFLEMVSLKGFPPKVIWIKRGNCSTNEIIQILNEHASNIIEFEIDQSNGLLILE